MLRWIWANISSLLLALVLALTVWVAAVSAEDPLEERTVPTPIPIETRNRPESLLIVGEPARDARIRIRAPSSVWQRLTPQDILIWIDLSGLPSGTHQVELEYSVAEEPVQVISIEPQTVTVTLEPSASQRFDVQVALLGDPAVGHGAVEPSVDPSQVLVIGPSSAVNQVRVVQAQIDISGRTQPVEQTVPLVALNEAGEEITDVEMQPNSVGILVPIEALGGYRSVVVLPRIVGEVEPGFQLTGITVSPTLVTVFSSDPQAVNELGGFVETEPVNVSGATAEFERRVSLNLPEGVSLVGDQSVLVRASISAIETSITITRTLETEGLGQGLFATISPTEVSLILKGPISILDSLQAGEVRVVVDLFGLEVGVHQLEPQVIVAPTELQVQTVLPDSIEVTISDEPPSTPTAAPTP